MSLLVFVKVARISVSSVIHVAHICKGKGRKAPVSTQNVVPAGGWITLSGRFQLSRCNQLPTLLNY